MINTAPPSSNSVYGRENFFPVTLFLFLCTVFFFFFFNTIFPFSLFFTVDPAGHALGSIYQYIFRVWVRSFILQKGFQKLLICILAMLTTRKKKKHKLSRPVPPLKQLIFFFFFSVLVDIMTNNIQYTTDCTNLHPTPTIDPLKVKLAFCTSS